MVVSLLCRYLMSSGTQAIPKAEVLRHRTWIKLSNVDGILQGRSCGYAQLALLYALR